MAEINKYLRKGYSFIRHEKGLIDAVYIVLHNENMFSDFKVQLMRCDAVQAVGITQKHKYVEIIFNNMLISPNNMEPTIQLAINKTLRNGKLKYE